MRAFFVLVCALGLALPLAGCSLLQSLLKPHLKSASDTTDYGPVAPPFLLQGKAAKFQDSLMPRLRWISQQKPKGTWTLTRLAFANLPDSSLSLTVVIEDSRRQNLHGREIEQVRQIVSDSLKSSKPLLTAIRQAGITNSVEWIATYRGRDFLRSSSKWVDDSARWVEPPSP